ncbi:arsenical pump-driving ATPase [Klebsiella pneumoniae]|nr:arsenical pump-driving ATPase [Klebsiella pneumoniae]
MAGLEKQREQYAHAVEALSDPERTRLVLVARLQNSTLQEVARTHEELAEIGLKNQYLVINGVLPEAEAEHDALAAAIWQREQEALANLPAGLSELPTDTLLLQPVNMVGVSALKGLLATRSEALPLPVTNILYTPESTLTMKPNAIASMFLRRREEIWTKQGNGYWKRIYALPVLKKLPCFRPSPV